MTSNYSFHAIPAFFLLAHIPTFAGTSELIKARNGQYDHRNPRGSSYMEDVKKSVPKETFERYERYKAAHHNSLENFPLFAATIICGNMARLDAETLNLASAAYLIIRLLYLIAYVGITKHKYSFARSGLWSTSIAVCFYVLIVAGNVMVNGGPRVS